MSSEVRMMRVIKYVVFCCVAWLFSSAVGFAQGFPSTTYYLHKETVAPWTTMPTLRTANPDQGSSFAQSPNYRNSPSRYLDPVWKTFRSVPPSTPGTLLAGSTLTFTVWMKKSAAWGTVYPYLKLWTYDNNDVLGGNLIPVCAVTGNSALDTSITKYIITCSTPTSIPVTATRAYRLDVGSYVDASPMQHNMTVSVYFDGVTFSGSYPSSVVIPNPVPPVITGLSASSGPIGSPVTIHGNYFGNVQGASTVQFNGVNAPVTSWSNTSIEVTVPVAGTGSVVVNVNGAASNVVQFQIIRPTISSVYPDHGTVGTPVTLTGLNFGESFDPASMSLLFNGVQTIPTSWSDTSIQATVPSTASGPVVVRVNGIDSNAVDFTVTVPAISGITPSAGYVGGLVTISGSGFGDSYNPSFMSVSFNDVVAMPVRWNDTSIRIAVPSTTTGPVAVRIYSVVSNSVVFTVLPNVNTARLREYVYLGNRPLAIESGTGGSSSGSGGYSFVRPLTINHNLVAGSQANFPVLVAKTHAHLRTVSNGGWIQRLDGGKPARSEERRVGK